MTAGTIAVLRMLNEEVLGVISDTLGNLYMGTNQGNVYKYAIASATLTKLCNIGVNVIDLTLYGNYLYLGGSGGKLLTVTIS
jgi:hypothetical protein